MAEGSSNAVGSGKTPVYGTAGKDEHKTAALEALKGGLKEVLGEGVAQAVAPKPAQEIPGQRGVVI